MELEGRRLPTSKSLWIHPLSPFPQNFLRLKQAQGAQQDRQSQKYDKEGYDVTWNIFIKFHSLIFWILSNLSLSQHFVNSNHEAEAGERLARTEVIWEKIESVHGCIITSASFFYFNVVDCLSKRWPILSVSNGWHFFALG